MPQNHLLRPTDEQLLDVHTDITAPSQTVEVKMDNRGVLWVNVGPVCVLRICRMSNARVEIEGEAPIQATLRFSPPDLPPITSQNG